MVNKMPEMVKENMEEAEEMVGTELETLDVG